MITARTLALAHVFATSYYYVYYVVHGNSPWHMEGCALSTYIPPKSITQMPTRSGTQLLHGVGVRQGTHVDLMMREAASGQGPSAGSSQPNFTLPQPHATPTPHKAEAHLYAGLRKERADRNVS